MSAEEYAANLQTLAHALLCAPSVACFLILVVAGALLVGNK